MQFSARRLYLTPRNVSTTFHRYIASTNNIETTAITLDMIHTDLSRKIRNTKIVCTIGPACWTHEGILGLIDNGMNLARLNFSHGDHEGHGKTVSVLREAAKQTPGTHVRVDSVQYN